MKMKHLIVAAAIASLPTTALAQGAVDKKKAAAEAKAKALEEAKEKARAEAEAAAKAVAVKATATNVAKKATAAAANEEAKKAEEETHQKFLGMIERLDQIATATDNAELKAKVSALRTKADARRTLATAG